MSFTGAFRLLFGGSQPQSSPPPPPTAGCGCEAPDVPFTPGTPGDWAAVPDDVGEALDELAANGGSDAYTPAVVANWGQTPPGTKSIALDFLVNVNLEPHIYYVNSALGNNLNSGSYYAPFATLQKAIDVYLSLDSGNRVTIRLVSSISAADSLHLDTGLHVRASSTAPPLIIESATNERQVVECDVNVFGTKGITLNFNNIYLTTKALVPGAPNLQIVQTTGSQFFVSFDNCELNRLEANSEGIIFTNIKYMAFRQSVFRNGLFADVLFTNVNFVVFYDSLVDPFSPLSLNNIHFISTAVICKIIIMSAGMPQADVVSDGVIPPFWYRQFNGKNPEFAVSGGGQIRVGIIGDVVFSSVAPALTLVSGVTLEMMNCKSLSNIVVDAGATLTTQQCKLLAIANAGAWDDSGSTVASVSGDGTTTYNGTIIATPGVLTASRTQLGTDSELDVDATAGNIVYQLKPVASVPMNHKIKLNRGPGGPLNSFTPTPDGAETIDGLASITLAEYQTVNLVRKSTFWSAR